MGGWGVTGAGACGTAAGSSDGSANAMAGAGSSGPVGVVSLEVVLTLVPVAG